MNTKHKIVQVGRNPEEKSDLVFKTILVGDTAVGKTALSKKGVSQGNEEVYSPTISPELFWMNYKVDSQLVCHQIWDTCGQETFQSITNNFYRASDCVVLVYSITNTSSFLHLGKWLQNAKEHIDQDPLIILVGNKADMEGERTVTYEMGEQFKNQNNINYFLESSVKEGMNVEELFNYILDELYERYLNENCESDDGINLEKSTLSIDIRDSRGSIRKSQTNGKPISPCTTQDVFEKEPGQNGFCGCV